jgi:hypothetical protein
MPDNKMVGLTNVATDELETLNGAVQKEPLPNAERVKIVHGPDGSGTDTSAAAPLPTTDDGLGADGDAPPALAANARGVRGWLRAIYEKLAGTLTVHVDNETPATDVSAIGAVGDAATANTVIGRLKAIANALAATASNWLSVRLTDGTSYLQSTAGRLQVADGGVALGVAPTGAGDVAGTLTPGRQTVTTPGTAVAIRASLACKWVQVTALKTNTQQVNVGGTGVLATIGASTGDPLDAGESVSYPVDNANKVFVDARVAGEGVSFTVGSP